MSREEACNSRVVVGNRSYMDVQQHETQRVDTPIGKHSVSYAPFRALSLRLFGLAFERVRIRFQSTEAAGIESRRFASLRIGLF